MPLIEIRNLSKIYDLGEVQVAALRDVSLDIHEGEFVALIGPSGSGKSTLMNTICGGVRAREGAILFDGHDLRGLPTHRIMRLGLAFAPEGRRIFPRMTVLENLQMGAAIDALKHFDEDLARVLETFPRLANRLHQRGGTLSGGEQQMLAIGRALMMRPRLLLLDEPSLGLAPLVVHTIFEAIDEIKSKGTTILLVEQNAHAALGHSDRAYVLETGRIVMEGPSKDLANDPRIKEAYLGE